MTRPPRPRPITWAEVMSLLVRIADKADELIVLPRVPRPVRQGLLDIKNWAMEPLDRDERR